jgi:hypothetical protein
MTLADRMHEIENAAKQAAEHVAAAVAEHLPAIMNDPLLTAIEDAALTPAERQVLAGLVTAGIKMLRAVPQPPQPVPAGTPVDLTGGVPDTGPADLDASPSQAQAVSDS